MALTKLYQVVSLSNKDNYKAWLTKRTEAECEEYLNSQFPADYMSDVYLTILPVWTNASEPEIKRLLKEK